jgi:hypothetical protein
MKKNFTTFYLFLALTVIVYTFIYNGMRAGKGLVHFFLQFGIELDFTIIIIVLGLIPAFWIISIIIKTWTAK